MTLYAEPMLTSSEVAGRLGVTPRQARTLIGRHPGAKRAGRTLLLPERCLPDLESRRGRGRPRGIVLD